MAAFEPASFESRSERPPQHGRRHNRLLVTISLAGVAGLLEFELRRSCFRSYSISSDNGEMQFNSEWQIPFTSIVFWTSRSYRDSNLSVVVKRYGLATAQSQNWQYVRGTDGHSFAIGSGAELAWVSQATYVARFLDCACRSGETQFAKDWLKLLLDPAKTNDARFAIPEIPPAGLSNQKQFDDWWNIQKQNSTDFLRQAPPRLAGN